MIACREGCHASPHSLTPSLPPSTHTPHIPSQDKATAAAVSERLAGPRAGRVLPVLLTHQAKSTKEEQVCRMEGKGRLRQ
jgi:hypothetical protein